MAPVIVRRKNGVFRVFSFQHPRRVRHANVEAAVRRVLARGFDHPRSGLLLENVPDHLNGVHVRLALAQLDGFVQPADRGTECCAPDLDEPLILHFAQRLPDGSVAHVVHLDVMELENVDVIRLETLEALVHREAHVVAVESLRELILSAARGLRGFVIDVVADFGSVHDLAALSAKRFRELALAAAIAVRVGGVEKVDAEV